MGWFGNALGDAWDWTKDHAGTIAGAATGGVGGAAIGALSGGGGGSGGGSFLGGVADKLMGSGNSSFDPNSGVVKPLDPNDFHMGGDKDWTKNYDASQQADAKAADARSLDQDRFNAAAGQLSGATTAYRDAAMGVGPSVAALQQQQGLGQAMQQSQSLAASARGGGANLAAAQRAAMQNNSQMGQQGVNNAAMLRANEIAQARQGWMSGASQMQQGALGQQQNIMHQTGMNDARYGADMNRGYQAQVDERNARQAAENQYSNSYQNALQEKWKRDQNQANAVQGWFNKAASAVSGAATKGGGGGGAAGGGGGGGDAGGGGGGGSE